MNKGTEKMCQHWSHKTIKTTIYLGLKAEAVVYFYNPNYWGG